MVRVGPELRPTNMKPYTCFLKLFCVCLIAPLYIAGCASASGTLNLAQDLSGNDVATITLTPKTGYSCKFDSVGNHDITNNPSKVIVSPGRNMVDISCRITFAFSYLHTLGGGLHTLIGGSLTFEAEAGHEYMVYPENMCLKIQDSYTGKILDTYCH